MNMGNGVMKTTLEIPDLIFRRAKTTAASAEFHSVSW